MEFRQSYVCMSVAIPTLLIPEAKMLMNKPFATEIVGRIHTLRSDAQLGVYLGHMRRTTLSATDASHHRSRSRLRNSYLLRSQLNSVECVSYTIGMPK